MPLRDFLLMCVALRFAQDGRAKVAPVELEALAKVHAAVDAFADARSEAEARARRVSLGLCPDCDAAVGSRFDGSPPEARAHRAGCPSTPPVPA